MTRKTGWIKFSDGGNNDRLVVGGVWSIDTLPQLSHELTKLKRQSGGSGTKIDAREVTRIDSAGAWFLDRTARDFGTDIAAVEGLQPRFRSLLERAAHAQAEAAKEPKRREASVFIRKLAHLGKRAVAVGHKAYELISFLGLVIVALGSTLIRPWRLHGRAVLLHIEHAGLNALPIVGLMSFLVGIVIAYMGAIQLKRFGAEILTVDLVGVAVLRELGVLFAAILVAGRSGSAFTAQIGTMKVNQEIDAMRTIGLDPVQVLVLPRIIALVIAMPLLTIYANLMALAGGAVICQFVLDISITAFLEELNTAVDITSLLIGLGKAPAFAFAIAVVGCFEGFKVSGGATSVGQRTTTSVVESIFIVMIIDAVVAMTLSFLGI